ncbi:hypothetical protein ACFE04_007740 [Oxalis oulophora]
MINLLSMSLVITSLAFAHILSPNADPQNNNNNNINDVIMKQGHRVVVVEYDLDGQTNTKVSIKPPQHQHHHHHDGITIEETTEQHEYEYDDHHHHHPIPSNTATELICDAFGKCTRKIATAIGITKDKMHKTKEGVDTSYETLKETVKDTANGVGDNVANKAHDAKESIDKARQNAANKAQDVKETAKESIDKARQNAANKAQDVKETAKDSIDKARENAASKARHVKECAQESMDKARDSIEDAKVRGKKMAGDVAMNTAKNIKTLKTVAHKVKSGAWWLLYGTVRPVFNLIRYIASPQAFNALMVIFNLLGFATAYGMCVWVTFVSSYVLAGSLPRQQFGLVQSRIYPVYFRVMTCCLGLALWGHVFVQRRKIFSDKAAMFQCYNLIASILMVLANLLVLEPRATKAMFSRMKIEKEEGKGIDSHGTDPAVTTTTTTAPTDTLSPASDRSSELDSIRSKMVKHGQRLKKLNSYSSILNILTLMALSWHLVYLAQRLLLTC